VTPFIHPVRGKLSTGAILGVKGVRNIKLCNFLAPGLPEPDPVEDWVTGYESALKMRGNDVCGDCAWVAFHNFVAVCASHTGDQYTDDEGRAQSDYSLNTGYDPKQLDAASGKNPTDNGTNPEDVFKYYSKLPDGDPCKILAWGEVDHNNDTELRQALKIFGGVYSCWALPETCQKQIGGVWDVTLIPGPWRHPGSLGGHATITQRIAVPADSQGVIGDTGTWADRQKFTYAFKRWYLPQAYFIVTPLWVANISNRTPSGFDLDGLLKYAVELRQS
jgi:hypothetical protein